MEMTLQEAQALMTPEAIDNLIRTISSDKTEIDTSKKSCNDILMQALCDGINKNIIKPTSLDEKTVKMLNSQTSSIAEIKFIDILSHIRQYQSNLICVIEIFDDDFKTVRKWRFPEDGVTFNEIFGYIIQHFKITPQLVRHELTQTLQKSIVNNIAQDVSNFTYADDNNIQFEKRISIITITRLVNMCHCGIIAEFIEE